MIYDLKIVACSLLGLTAVGAVPVFVHEAGNERAQVSAINCTQDPYALLTVQPRTIGLLTMTRKF